MPRCGFESVNPNELMVISGCCLNEPYAIKGGRVWVWPCGQVVQRLTLNIMTLLVDSRSVLSAEGVAVTVSGVAQIKVDTDYPEQQTLAVRHFMNKSEAQIQDTVMASLEGHQREILGTMTIEQIYQDRIAFAERVYKTASEDFRKMGLKIVSYTLRDVEDPNGYLLALGKKKTAEVHCDARIGEAEAHRDTEIKRNECNQVQLATKYICDADIARSERDYSLKLNEFNKFVSQKKADSELEYDLQVAITKQRLKEEDISIEVVARRKMIEVERQEVERREKELMVQVRLPSEAEKNRMMIVAAGTKFKIVAEAEAQAEKIRLKGEAEAEAIALRGQAEAEAMQLKAQAFQQYGRAAVADMVFGTLPKVCAEVAAPLCNMDKLVMISADDEEVGAAKLTAEVIDIITQLPGLVQKLTGLDISTTVKDAMKT